MMKRYLTYIFLAVLAVLTGCSDDNGLESGEFEEGVMTRVSLRISSRRDATRATGNPEDPAYDIELIHDWWVAFVDKYGTVRAVVTRPNGTADGYVEEEKIDVDVPTGTYTIYAFANLTQTELKTNTGLQFTVGSAYPSDVETAQWQILQHWSNTADLPMSGKQSVTVTGRANEVFSIEVVRMLAKMDIQFINESVKDITINSIKMSQSPSDYVPLLPNYTYLDSGWPVGAVTPSVDLLGTVNADYSEKNKDYTNSHPITKNADRDWTISLHQFTPPGDPNWYSRIWWNTGDAVAPTDAIEVSMTLNADHNISGVQIGLMNSDQNDFVGGAREGIKLDLTSGVDTPVNFVLSGMTFSNARLQISAAYSDAEGTLLRVKDVRVNKVVSRPYLRSYDDPLVKTGGKPALAAYTPRATECAHTFDGSGTCTSCGAKSYTDRFYMRESQANYNIAQRYLMTVNVTRQDGHTYDQMFALTRELSSIYRNDHIVLPVILSDYMVSLDVNFYPPIGGYPAVITRESEEEFLCEFATQGTFEIMPKVINASNGYAIVYGTGNPHYTYEIKAISDPSHIFSVTPSIEVGTGETLGELSTAEGIAYVDIDVTVHRTGVADQIYERRIYIIRKN